MGCGDFVFEEVVRNKVEGVKEYVGLYSSVFVEEFCKIGVKKFKRKRYDKVIVEDF